MKTRTRVLTTLMIVFFGGILLYMPAVVSAQTAVKPESGSHAANTVDNRPEEEFARVFDSVQQGLRAARQRSPLIGYVNPVTNLRSSTRAIELPGEKADLSRAMKSVEQAEAARRIEKMKIPK